MTPALSALNGECAPEKLAALAGLKYVTDAAPGYARRRSGRGFVYQDRRGRRVAKASIVTRIETLAIPPAWSDVWICPQASGHLQATGLDQRRRKQYLYHPRWREASDLVKFQKLVPFGKALPALRCAIHKDLTRKTPDRDQVAALLVELLDRTAIRIGNEEYVRANQSFGLSTLRKRHVRVRGKTITLSFRAKGGLPFERTLEDARLARIIGRLLKLPGHELIQYVKRAEDGTESCVSLTAADANAYLQERAGASFTAKDFRMWKASAIVAGHLYRNRDAETQRARTRVVKESIQLAAEALANTTTVCRKSYIHPVLLEAFLDGRLREAARGMRIRKRAGSSEDEVVLLGLLRRLLRSGWREK